MTLISPPDIPPKPSRTPWILALAGLTAIAVGFLVWRLGQRPPERRATLPPVTKGTGLPVRATPTPPPSPSPSREARAPGPSTGTRTTALLHVEADVADASVFVDRRFVGKAPVDVADLSPGSHRINVSAEGYPMHAEEVETGALPRAISVRFTEVRLDETLAVLHKHTVGSCAGVLKASPDGLAFEATSGKDSFRAPFESLGRFEVDYLQKTLRVSLRGGRSYNFTVEGASADPLLVFQQKVDAVRKRL